MTRVSPWAIADAIPSRNQNTDFENAPPSQPAPDLTSVTLDPIDGMAESLIRHCVCYVNELRGQTVAGHTGDGLVAA